MNYFIPRVTLGLPAYVYKEFHAKSAKKNGDAKKSLNGQYPLRGSRNFFTPGAQRKMATQRSRLMASTRTVVQEIFSRQGRKEKWRRKEVA